MLLPLCASTSAEAHTKMALGVSKLCRWFFASHLCSKDKQMLNLLLFVRQQAQPNISNYVGLNNVHHDNLNVTSLATNAVRASSNRYVSASTRCSDLQAATSLSNNVPSRVMKEAAAVSMTLALLHAEERLSHSRRQPAQPGVAKHNGLRHITMVRADNLNAPLTRVDFWLGLA